MRRGLNHCTCKGWIKILLIGGLPCVHIRHDIPQQLNKVIASSWVSFSTEYDGTVVKLHSKSDVRKMTTDNFVHRNEMDNANTITTQKQGQKRNQFSTTKSILSFIFIFFVALLLNNREKERLRHRKFQIAVRHRPNTQTNNICLHIICIVLFNTQLSTTDRKTILTTNYTTVLHATNWLKLLIIGIWYNSSDQRFCYRLQVTHLNIQFLFFCLVVYRVNCVS